MKTRQVKVFEGEGPSVESTNCCGIYEVYGIDWSPWQSIFKISLEIGSSKYNLLIFHDAVENQNGEKLASLIRRYKLGKVVKSKEVRNPNTNRNICMWTFYPDWVAIRNITDTAESIDEDCDWCSEYIMTVPVISKK